MMRIEVWADVVCPWCYIGKRRFERALASFPHRAEIEVVHRSFQLDPTIPAGHVVKQAEVLATKYHWSPNEVRTRQEQLERLGADEGLVLRLQHGLTGNTVDAHRLIHLARERGRADAMVERLYQAHFAEERSIFDQDSLVTLATDVGLPVSEAREVLQTDAYADAVVADGREAQRLGATGVPFFVIDRRVGISGAQRAEIFTRVLTQAWSDSHPAPSAGAAPAAVS